MSFEKMWTDKLSSGIAGIKGSEYKDALFAEFPHPGEDSSIAEVNSWTASIVARLRDDLSSWELHSLFTGCACHYPVGQLIPIRDAFRVSGSFPEAQALLNEQFTVTMRDGLGIPVDVINKLLADGMGPAGILEESRLIATKIPKSGYLMEWLSETDPEVRRKLYCHCPRIRNAIGDGADIDTLYCLCGAGFYRNIWETITEDHVRVEVLESVMKGDDFCRIAVYPDSLKA